MQMNKVYCSDEYIFGFFNREQRSRGSRNYFDDEDKNFHKCKSDFYEKLSTRAHLFNDLLYFKGCPYLNHGFI